MTKIKFLSISLVSFFVLISLIANYSYAQEQRGNLLDNDRKEKLLQKTQQITEKCSQILNKIDQRLQAFEANKTAKEQVYANIIDKLDRIITRLKDERFDTSKLESDKSTLNNMISKYWSDRQIVADYIAQAKNLSCESIDKSEYRQKIQSAKDLHVNVQTDIEDIKNFLRGTVKVDIQNIRQLKQTEGDDQQ